MPIKKIRKRLSRYLRRAAEVLDPAKADPRGVTPPGGQSRREEQEPQPRHPEEPHTSPDAKELEKEHRGF
ncbi:MAG: hypothetical protein HY875_14045 [Chloroflexi bacterium]|nr:hypothetical protein [Chloroflexota bacterium]